MPYVELRVIGICEKGFSTCAIAARVQSYKSTVIKQSTDKEADNSEICEWTPIGIRHAIITAWIAWNYQKLQFHHLETVGRTLVNCYTCITVRFVNSSGECCTVDFMRDLFCKGSPLLRAITACNCSGLLRTNWRTNWQQFFL